MRDLSGREMTGSLQKLRPSKPVGAEETKPQIRLSRHVVARAIISVSLANLCFISAWQRRIYGEPFFSPLWSWSDLFALVLNVIGLAAFLYFLLTLAARIKVRGYGFDALVYALPLFSVSNEVRRALSGHASGQTAIALMALPGIFCVALFCYQRKLLPVTEFLAIGLAILFPFNLMRSAWIVEKRVAAPSLAAKFSAPVRPGPRVIWLVFDETDFSLSFYRRPANLRVPALDRLRSEAFFAEAAHQPGGNTFESMPNLISGGPLSGKSQAKGTRTFLVKLSPQSPPVDWGVAPSVFSDARAAHMNVGIVGWFFPYCRIFAAVVSECYSEPMYSGLSDQSGLGDSVIDQLDSLTPLESRVRLIQRLRRMVAASESMTNDPQLGLVLIHLPVPHGPPIFDRESEEITPFNLRKDWFFDNLMLADRVMGEIREAMERSGEWDNSVVILTSDHSLRQYMMPHQDPTPLVPFIVKMPGQTKGTSLDIPFNTDLTRDLIGAIRSGEVTSATLPGWVQQHAH